MRVYIEQNGYFDLGAMDSACISVDTYKRVEVVALVDE